MKINLLLAIRVIEISSGGNSYFQVVLGTQLLLQYCIAFVIVSQFPAMYEIQSDVIDTRW